jgi:uncharacterized phage protein gp47/JayE
MSITYGLTPAGFVPKTSDVIEAEITADIKSVPGLEDIQTDAGSGWGNLIAILTEREALLWLLMLLVWQSAFRDYATGLSLDNAISLIGQSRQEERRSTVTLRLFNRTSTSPVTVSADNQARQAATGVLWELTEDAEIPALGQLHTGLALGNLTWQSGTTVRAYLPASTNLSIVAIGDKITLIGCTHASNDGMYTLTNLSDVGDWVEYLNPSRTSATDNETNSPGTADLTDVEAWIDVPAQSYSAGAFEATENSIQQIATPLSGWDFVTNPEPAITGREQENDSNTRRRVAGETVSAKGGTLEAVKAALLAVPGVTYVSAKENDQNVAVDGLKKNSMHFVVVGGTDQAVFDCIGRTKPAGIGTNGSEAGTWINSTGQPVTIYFDRVDEVALYYIVNLGIDPALYPADGDDLVKAAMVATTWTHGEDAINHKMAGAISYTSGVPGILTIEVLQSRTVSPVSSANVTIASTEVLNPALDRITVNTTP